MNDIIHQEAIYDTIGVNYTELRRPDTRLASTIWGALGSAESILNVGAGTGSYEPTDRPVIAVDPSREMLRKRSSGAATVIQASAEALPFPDKHFDTSMAILTIHHQPDKERGLRELSALDDKQMPAMADYERWLGPVSITAVPIPHDCSDGFLYA